MASSSPVPDAKDWSATQYLKFHSHRTRPVYDLIAQLAPHIGNSAQLIVDLGCGPGNSTEALLSAFPGARITGLDSSPDMLKRARATLPDVEFQLGDVGTFEAPQGTQVLFSNAVFHWLRSGQRIPTLTRLVEGLGTGGVLAVQMPDNYNEPSHALMREVALLPDRPWSSFFADANVGVLGDTQRPDLDPVEPISAYLNALDPLAQDVDVWRTEYHHLLADPKAIVEWVKGTGLQPFLHRMEKDEDAKREYLDEYEKRLAEAYPKLNDGRVVLVYPRLFVVATRK